MIYTALFTALTFAATYIKINFSIGGMIHLGNFVAILAALLFGGKIGGISGSLGMGLYDIINGYPYTTFIRTFIVKFCFCYIIGCLFRYLLKKEKEQYKVSIVLFIVSLIIASLSLTIYCVKPSFVKEPLIFIFTSILLFIFSLSFLILFLYKNKIGKWIQSMMISTSIGIMINVVLEFILRTFFFVLLGQDFHSSILTSILKTPSALINGVITILLVCIFYKPLYLATRKINLLNDIEEFLK